jgi:hypothetical protein
MNLARHASVLWRFRSITLIGLLFGIALAFLAAVKVPEMQRRGTETWSATSDIFVTQPGFPWGRVTLPSQNQQNPLAKAQSQGQAQAQATPTPSAGSQLQFADPSRFSSLALLYSVIAYSDQVRTKLPGHPAPGQIQAQAIDATGNGTVYLPIIRLTTQSDTAEGALKLNNETITGLTDLLESNQRDADIAKDSRVQLSVLNAPKTPTLVKGRSLTPSILAFMLCVLAAIAIAHILEALRPRPEWARLRAAEEMQDAGYYAPAPAHAAQPHSPVSAVPPPPATTSHWASGTSARAAVADGAGESDLREPGDEPRRRIFR